MLRTLLACFVSAGALGCDAAAATEFVLVVETDLRVPFELDAVRIRGVEPDGDEQIETVAVASRDEFPVTLGIRHRGGALGLMTVAVTGLLEEDVVVERFVSAPFVREESRLVFVVLSSDCLAIECDDDQTCDRGDCVDAEVDPSDLPPFDGTLPVYCPCDKDLNDDGMVGLQDILDGSEADVNCDGALDACDISNVMSGFGGHRACEPCGACVTEEGACHISVATTCAGEMSYSGDGTTCENP